MRAPIMYETSWDNEESELTPEERGVLPISKTWMDYGILI